MSSVLPSSIVAINSIDKLIQVQFKLIFRSRHFWSITARSRVHGKSAIVQTQNRFSCHLCSGFRQVEVADGTIRGSDPENRESSSPIPSGVDCAAFGHSCDVGRGHSCQEARRSLSGLWPCRDPRMRLLRSFVLKSLQELSRHSRSSKNPFCRLSKQSMRFLARCSWRQVQQRWLHLPQRSWSWQKLNAISQPSSSASATVTRRSG